MTIKDLQGHALTGATPAALDAYEQALHQTRCLVGDPVASVDRALAAAPDMTMAHALKAWLMLLGTEPSGPAAARACCAAGAALAADERERAHLRGAALLADGHWHTAARALEDLALAHPRDALALQVGHQLDFFTGDSRMLRDRIARALPSWDAGTPGFHALLGMHAFGLEETGDYDAAERQGQRAVELQPHDSWGWHAVAHVAEMRNAPRAGIAWLQPNTTTWAEGSFLAVHNWWHLALFHLELDDIDEVLRLYDAAIGGPASSVVLDLLDQSALLWRLMLRGIDVGRRWQPLAERWAAVGGAGTYAFNDLHAAMACIGADREAALQALLAAQDEAMARDDDNAAFTREVGSAATRALVAFGAGDFRTCVELLRPIRHRTHRFGGSHAQRDLIDQTLIEAALRGGDGALAAGLIAERAALRPQGAPTRHWAARSRALNGMA
ncbi:MAG TPA: tetratricopeptide repeat protein [Methylibium sp.]|nr:tetratricopeptide repeat protein [Methylibium sp.]